MDARLVWLSSSSRADLEASSSVSVLQSIYGSQVWQLPFSETSISQSTSAEDESIWQRKFQAAKRVQRPQSASPVLLARQRQQSLQAGVGMSRPPSSVSRRALPRPTTAAPTVRLPRPSTARSTPRPPRPSTFRPRQAVVQARKSRPSTAMPLTQYGRRPSRPSSHFSSVTDLPEEFSEYYDDLESVCDFPEPTTPLTRDTPPVSLGTVPEYFNFWQGKPLKVRDWGMPQYGRKSRRRPKSDYGSRFYSGKSGQGAEDGAGKGDGTEGEDGSNLDHLMGLRGKGGRDGKDETESLGNDGRTGKKKKMSEDFDGKLGTGEDGDKDADGAGGFRDGMDRRGGATHSSWGGRGKLDQTGQDDDDDMDAVDDYFDKLKLGFLGGSLKTSYQNVTRFELPMDLKTLERMTPSDYLIAHCIISQRRWSHYLETFSKINKEKLKFIDQKNLLWGLKEAHYNCLTNEQGQSIIELVQLTEEQTVSQRLFAAICALTERIFGAECLPRAMPKEIIEVVDFEALDWKLRGCNLSQPLRMLLNQL